MKRFVFQIHNDWKQLVGKFNWYNFVPIHLSFNYDKWTEGIEFEVIVLGLGVFIRYNLPASDAIFAKWAKEAEDEYEFVKKKKKRKIVKKKIK